MYSDEKEAPLCYYCDQPADGPMLSIGEVIAHPICVITALNKLLDPDYNGIGEPQRIIKVSTG